MQGSADRFGKGGIAGVRDSLARLSPLIVIVRM
jgi:hypothetical protein